MSDGTYETETGPSGLVFRIAEAWALLGGVVLLGVVLMHTWSVIGNNWGSPFPGDFELTEMGVAITAFAFLPYCQISGANVTADIFTSGLSQRWIAFFALVSSVIAILFSSLLLWRMYAGMMDTRTYEYETAVLQLPNWWAWPPILLSLALLAVTSLTTLIQASKSIRS